MSGPRSPGCGGRKKDPESADLHNHALLLLLFPCEQGSAGSMLEHFSDTLVGLGGALEILLGTNLLSDVLGLFWGDWLLRSLVELFDGLLVIPEILLAAHEDDGQALAEVQDLRDPLLLHVVKRVGGVDGEADQNNVGIWVGKRTETIVIFLASRIPQGQFDMLSIDLNIGNVVLEDGRDVDLRERPLGEDNQQTSLSTGSVSNDDELSADFSHDLECIAVRAWG